jgi:hypothetical protein
MEYINGMTLEDITERLNYSASHIRKKRAELVKTIKFDRNVSFLFNHKVNRNH